MVVVSTGPIGFVFQSFNLLARTSALKNVELPLIYVGLRPRERGACARAALEVVDRIDGQRPGRGISRVPVRGEWRRGHLRTVAE